MPNFRCIVLLASSLLFACATAPFQEMSDARQAIESAIAVGANEHTSAAMHEAGKLMGQAQQALESRKYNDARRMALEAKMKAISARTVVQKEALLPETTRFE